MPVKRCAYGHTFIKSSDCPVCPACEKLKKPADNFLSRLAAPGRRALENNGISQPDQLSAFSEKEILSLHGMGKSTVMRLRQILKDYGLSFKT